MNWDDSQGRFVDDWELIIEDVLTQYPDNVPFTYEAQQRCFFVLWKRSNQVSERRLSSDGVSTGIIVLGSIEICLPAVLFNGINTCSEINNLLSKLDST